MVSKTLLSTKILTLNEQSKLAGFELTHYNAIEIREESFTSSRTVNRAIITSQNAAKIIIKKGVVISNAFCVGSKTAALLKGSGYEVQYIAKNALALGEYLVENYSQEEFVFFCGDKRRDELPSLLLQNSILFKEKKVYTTHLVSRKFNKQFGAVLFFSPSGVEIYVSKNNLGKSIAFCIGETTANTAKKYTDSIVVANETTIESVLESIIDYKC